MREQNYPSGRAGLEAALRASQPLTDHAPPRRYPIEAPPARSIAERALIAHINDRNHTQCGTRNYLENPVKSVDAYARILARGGAV